MLDGIIDFDRAVRNPEDTAALQSQFLFENDWLHLNAQGYETMGNCIDLSLFTKTEPVSDVEDEDDYGQAIWIEAEDLRSNTAGTAFQVVSDVAASGGKYLKTVTQTASAAPTDKAYILTANFKTDKADTYYIYARVLCPTWDDDSYWVSVDSPLGSNFANGLQTASWDWKELYHGTLQTGDHQLNIGGREDGACLDKLCIAANPEPPTGMGGVATSIKAPALQSRTVGSIDTYSLSGIRLTAQNAGPCIEVRRANDGTIISRRLVLLSHAQHQHHAKLF